MIQVDQRPIRQPPRCNPPPELPSYYTFKARESPIYIHWVDWPGRPERNLRVGGPSGGPLARRLPYEFVCTVKTVESPRQGGLCVVGPPPWSYLYPETQMDRFFNKKRKKSPKPPQQPGPSTNTVAGPGFRAEMDIDPKGGRNCSYQDIED